ncbi:MAG: phospholipase D-like domain-containing protein, partial [Cyanobium sp.]
MPEDGGQAVVDLIASTSQQLLLKQFKLESSAVLEAHRRGVEVRARLNPHTLGGDRWIDAAFSQLEATGIAVSWTSDAFSVTHEKSMVFDRESALISTFNLSDKYFTQTRDYGVLT